MHRTHWLAYLLSFFTVIMRTELTDWFNDDFVFTNLIGCCRAMWVGIMIGLFMICFHWFDWLLQSNVNWYVIVMDTVTVRLQILAYVCTVSITLLVSDMSIICLLCLCLFYVDSSEIFRFLNVYGIHPTNPVLVPEKIIQQPCCR